MNVHEYQAKELLKQYGVPVLENRVIFKPEDAEQAAKEFVEKGSKVVVLKSQVHAGGRGKGKVHDINTDVINQIDGKDVHGVNVLFGDNLPSKAKAFAEATLGNKLITIQTGEAGSIVNRMMLEDGASIDKEFYISILLDRATSKNIIMASTEGGVEIEKVAEETPEKILKAEIDPMTGAQPYQGRELAFKLGLEGVQIKQFVTIFMGLAKLFQDLDLALIEINPLVITDEGNLHCLDAKLGVDSNAMYRQAKLRDMHDPSQEDAREAQAAQWELNYVALDGNIGCMVNGAGLAMGTMDIVKLHGGQPANFLDVGGGATKERVSEAFKIILSDDTVQAVLVNIFGGIVRCDLIAEGIIGAVNEVGVEVPVVVRLEGNNAELGSKLLAESGLNIIAANSLKEAADAVVKAAEGK